MGSNPISDPRVAAVRATRFAEIGALCAPAAPSSSGQDTRFSSWQQGFDSPRGHRSSFGEQEIVGGDTGLLGFEVYRDGALAGEYADDAHEGVLPGAGTYEFRVDAVYEQGTWTGAPREFEWDGVTRAAETAALPQRFEVGRAYPNPFNPATTLTVTVPEAADLDVRVFNSLGQEVRSVADRRVQPGEHRIVFDATGLASGVYLLHVRAGTTEDIQKVIYLR